MNQVSCIGNRADNGCGYLGGESGGTCPECGGMLLSERAIEIADKATEDWMKRLRANSVQDASKKSDDSR